MAGQITIDILADTRKLVQGVEQANGTLNKLANNAGKLARVGTAIAGVGVAFQGLARIGGVVADATKQAIEFNDSVDAVKLTLKDGAAFADFNKFLETSATKLGLSKKEAAQYGAQLIGIGQGAGLRGKELEKFGETALQVAVDLRSKFGGSLEEALTATKSAFSGEYTPLKKYGLSINDATLKQFALAKGIIKTTKGALDPQTKTLATFAYLTSTANDSIGNFGDTVGYSVANQLQVFNAQLDDAKTQLGSVFIPALAPVVKFLSETAIPAFKALPEPIQAFIVAIVGLTVVAIPLGIAIAGLAIAQTALNVAMLPIIGIAALIILGLAALIAVGVLLYKNWDKVKEVAGNVWEAVIGFITPVFEAFKRVFSAIWEGVLKPFLQILGGIVAIILTVFLTPFVKLFEGLKAIVQKALELAAGPFNWFITKVKEFINMIKTPFSNFVSGFVNIGQNIVKGLWTGISSLANWLRDKFFAFFGNLIPGWVKKMLGIASPSKVFFGFGQNIVKGLSNGITGTMGAARMATQNLANATTSGFQPQFAGAGGGVNITINAGIGTDSIELGRTVKQALDKYAGVNGK